LDVILTDVYFLRHRDEILLNMSMSSPPEHQHHLSFLNITLSLSSEVQGERILNSIREMNTEELVHWKMGTFGISYEWL
jgi:hypothetical protein